jgi:ribosomal protein S12 methylthiotransferase accessory factor
VEAKRSIGPLADVVSYLVDPKVGIVGEVEEILRDPGAPEFFHFAAKACDTRAFNRQANFRNTGGASVDRERAAAKAIGEAVERYCAALYEVEDLPLCSSADAAFKHVPPAQFALHSSQQYEQPGFPWVPFGTDTAVRWVEATDFEKQVSVFVPAAMVFVPYVYYRGSGDSPIVQPISTGLACHSSFERAALAAIYEVVERDAFTITWQAGLAPPHVRVETLSDASYELVERFERTGSTITIFDITLDHGIATFLAVLRSPNPESPALVFAAAAALEPDLAVHNALEELAHTRRYSQQIKRHMRPVVKDENFTEVVDQLDHLNLYADHANQSLADFLFKSHRRLDFEEIVDRSTGNAHLDLVESMKLVRQVGHVVLLIDLTQDDVRNLGLTVVRAVIPGFQPLYMGHRIRALGGSRLRTVPQKMGYAPHPNAEFGNSAPHPYP